MVQVSQGTSRFSCTFFATLIAGLLVLAGALVASDENKGEKERTAKDNTATTKTNRYRLSVFNGLPEKEGAAKSKKPVFENIITANKPFEFKVKDGLGASGILREDKKSDLHFKGQINFSPGVGIFDQPVKLGQGVVNRGGFSSGGFFSFFIKFEPVADDDEKNDNSESSDTEALIFEMQSKSSDGLVKLEVMITPGSDFRMSSTIDRVKWTLYGSVEKVVDGVATISAPLKRNNSVVLQLADGKFNIDSLENFAWAGIWGGSEISRYWIRKGVDPVPVVNRILARRDKSFAIAASYLTELESEAQTAALPQLIAALNDGIDNSKRPPYDTLRASAAKTLGKFGATAKAAVPALVQRLKDENGYIRVDAATALWRIEQHAAAVPALVAELKNEAWNIRSRAVGNLGDITATENSSVTIPALIGTFENDENENVRRRAAYALATTGELAKSAVPTLTSALKDESEEIRRAARYAIEVISGRSEAPRR